MALEVRSNRRFITLKAAFIVAFFASFFVSADYFNWSLIQGYEPKVDPVTKNEYHCVSADPDTTIIFTAFTKDEAIDRCKPYAIAWKLKQLEGNCDIEFGGWGLNGHTDYGRVTYRKGVDGAQCKRDIIQDSARSIVSGLGVVDEDIVSCPPFQFPEYLSGPTGPQYLCYKPEDLEAFYRDSASNSHKEENCKNLVLDSGNNTADNMCYTAPDGSSCSVTRVFAIGNTQTEFHNFSYYVGTGLNDTSCTESGEPPYNPQGTGDTNDKCISSGGVNYCEANKSKHCSYNSGVEICDDGCLEVNGSFMCDPSLHPDVGEGDSNYFDDNGTCSVISASAYRGLCEDMGGTWDESGDFTEQSCPSSNGGGTCSISGSTSCYTCLDSGGTWEPDPNAPPDDTNGLKDVAALIKSGNTKLTAIENSTRKGTESLISTVKSTNNKLISELKKLNGGVVALKEDDNKETFTTKTQEVDKSLMNGLFSAEKITALQTEIETKKEELQTFITNSKSELGTLLSISPPSSGGYQARSFSAFGANLDISMSRFSNFFQMLAGPVMLLCSIIALFIILGRN